MRNIIQFIEVASYVALGVAAALTTFYGIFAIVTNFGGCK